ncbi:metallophosphoesterase [Christiangramia sp. SM2212]|uniref:Metallophosphoesterase n=1 Tax=Christiangramia sediminicola TaxID=3073267 RepID=A0ABU1EQD8_9FLAO|nr:metallophosphoesterase [Christiangramia sp. SM2212]MDR5590600.1 metallophosphoesterase [Christiangramia sp. SM2212]
MKKVKLLAPFIILFLVFACATVEPKYRDGEPKSDFGYPTNKEIEKSFYLLGDGGYSPPGGTSLGLIAFKRYLDSVNKTENYTIFLGDNIYPDGMPPEGSSEREAAEYRLDAQLDAIENYKGKVVVIPGNHDWYNEKLNGLERQKDYLKSKFEDILLWSPEIGCGLQSLEISENIQLIVIDSQWYLEDWDKNPKINDNCEQIKTREAMFLELESEIKKNQNKTTLIALHHPIYTNGVHGGQYTIDRHIYPSQKKIPLPILGSLATLIRTTGGVSIQDAQNNRYKSLANRLSVIAQGSERVIFASGHEHSLQYIEHDSVKQIVSGSGSKASYATLSNDGVFAYNGQGFAVLDVFKDGSSWVSFYGNQDNKPKLLFQKEVLETPVPFEFKDYPDSFPETMTTSIYKEDEDTDKSPVHETVWGERYRELYGTDVTLKVADLDTLYGGLEVVREGGGHQTVSLRVKDSLGREYNIRRLRKDALLFLQNVAFKNQPVENKLENTVAENLLTDFYTAAHPYGFLAIPDLSQAAGVYHTNPEVFYLPKQKALGKYNSVHGDDIYMIVERPEEGWTGYEYFGSPDHDIVSTADMIERLRRDEKYTLDEAAYVRARMFDMLIGDWDRHQDQWRWAEIEDADGNHIFEPIPRDRDQVFSNFDGAFFGTLRALTGFANQFAVYGDDIKDVEWFNIAAMGLDRSLLQNTGKETWLEQAKYIQDNVTDEAIKKAFSKLPEETSGETTLSLIENVKGRRNNIVDIAERYYEKLAKLAIVTGTDKDDFIDVVRMEDGNTRVTITRNKDGERAENLSDKIYKFGETTEIWVYGLDDDDKILVKGEGPAKIFVRVIGGQNNDVYTVENGSNLKLYDHKSLPNTVNKQNKAKVRFTDNYEINTYDKDKKTFDSGSILPDLGYNPDDAFSFSLEYVKSINKFKRNPFTSQYTFYGEYHSATNGFELNYSAEFASIVGKYNLLLGANYASPEYSENFFGFGNETSNFEDDLDMDYNRVGLNEYGVKASLVNKTPFGSFFGFTASFEGIEVQEDEGRFITEDFVTSDPDFFARKYFAGLDALYKYESYDDVLNPTRGMLFELNLGAKMNTADPGRQYGYFKPYMGFYNALTRNRKLVIKTRAEAHINIGTEYEFYQSAQLGADSGLRGYRFERYSGKSSFGTGADLRYSFNTVKTSFLPFQLGIYGGYDLGRVWTEEENSKVWHDSYGGGFWINSADAIQGKLSLFAGSEGARLQFSVGLKF